MGVDKFIVTGKSSAFGDVFSVRFTNICAINKA
ncbi:hypothetical protein IMAU10142_00113 [Lactobacillus helveticus]|nr:hypothetical protein LH5_01674 [Lactobacillus helveticus]NRN71848.1 hypothetical protein [Lactobacillus helveticus]NRN73794.1 hypothetical protein [Lactobacillus helveticus]NRN76967.1 hypothetical protein [Lactobacillus helveticus]NRN77821.1 hypothetical protein [Lactobacillus helveticus]